MKTYKSGKALYKLMNSAVYGKAMETIRNRIDVKLVSHKKDYLKGHLDQAICHKKYLMMIRQQFVKTKLH